MKITALAPWFGAKRNMAGEIIAELGPHSAYWEPFCGSMAVLLAKPSCRMETVNDLHGDLINLARTVQDEDEGPRLYRRLRRTLFSQAQHEQSAAFIREEKYFATPERAYHYFIASWAGRNGVSGTSSSNQAFCVRYTNRGGHAGTRFTGAVDSIPSWRRRLRTVTILSECGIELCRRIADEPNAVVYVDPPYLEKGCKYIHDFEAHDHVNLADALNRFSQTRVVLSYYDHPRLTTLYPGWTKVDKMRSKSLVNQGKRDRSGVQAAPEVLLINGPSLVKKDATQAGLFA